jgi:3-deoxy-D-manno-octulosonic-acid transferase
MSISQILYTGLMYLLTPLFLLRLYWKGRLNSAYRQRIGERFGWVKPSNQASIWVHAVSVGETMAAKPLVDALLTQYPNKTLWLTSTTPTGSATVQRLWGERVRHSYCPYDLPDALQRFLKRSQAQLCIILETEIWPTLFYACSQQQIPLLMANACLSARSLKGYQKVHTLVNTTLNTATKIMTRSAADATRLARLGVLPEKLKVCGNLKFELQIPAALEAQAQVLKASLQGRKIWVAASTHTGEDEIILEAFQRLAAQHPEALLILVPRHPERFAAVAQLCEQSGLIWQSRNQQATITPQTAILLGDTMGELLLWYAIADVALIGNSLLTSGSGHNPLEAAAFALPILTGRYTQNFVDMYPALVEQNAALVVSDKDALLSRLQEWLREPHAYYQKGQAARRFFEQNQGALTCILVEVNQVLAAR